MLSSPPSSNLLNKRLQKGLKIIKHGLSITEESGYRFLLLFRVILWYVNHVERKNYEKYLVARRSPLSSLFKKFL